MTTTDTGTVVERAAQAVALRHIGLLAGFDGSDIADELYEQAETAERWDISKALEASSDTFEVKAVRERLEQIVDAIRTSLPTLAELQKTRVGVDAVLTARPVLPYRSATVDGLSGVTVNGVDGQVVIDGLAHSPAAALELSAAIARAVRETTLGGCRG